MTKPISVLVTDLDNTLYDWLGMWHAAFGALLETLLARTGIPSDKLLQEIQEVHRRHGTAEYAFLLEELPSLRNLHPATDPLKIPLLYQDAIDAYCQARRERLRLYPTVMETLQHLKHSGCLTVGYTESPAFYTNYRLRRLGLDGLLDLVYSPPDHELPQGVSRDEIRLYPPESYELKKTKHRLTPEGELKPNPKLLLDILQDVNADPEDAIYVGDSLMKDVTMAQLASVTDVYAKYGDPVRREEYDLLRAVSRWTDEQIQEEVVLYQRGVKPTYVLESGFSDLLRFFHFVKSRYASCSRSLEK